MRKADLVLAALAAAALAATGAGVALSDAWTGERTVRFAAAEAPLPAMGPAPAGTAPARFEWPAPINATGVRLEVTVAFTGQAVQGGAATVTVRGLAPDGSSLPPQTRTMAIAQGATSAQAVVAYNATWLDVPGAVRDTRDPAARAWDGPLRVEVVVERPGDLPAASYSFTAAVAGSFTAYAAA